MTSRDVEGEEDIGRVYTTPIKSFQSPDYGSIAKPVGPVPVQEERADSEYIHVYHSSAGEKLVNGTGQDAKAKKCRCSSCSTCYRLSVLFTILLALLSFIGLIVSEFVPGDYFGNTFIYEDSIILMDRIDPLYYSSVKVRKENDRQDHMFSVYLLSCDTTIVERVIVAHNTTFVSHVNVMLLPQDAMFLIEGSLIEINCTILNSTLSSDRNSTFVISNDLNTLKQFKENEITSSTASTFIASVSNNDVNQLSYDIDKTDYYYIGFSPSGNTSISIEYKIYGFKYSRPNLSPACILHRASDRCFIHVPTSLSYSYDGEYCLLGELVSEPYYVDLISIDVAYEVDHHGKWNFITIMFVCLLSCSCVLSVCVVVYLCVGLYCKSKSSSKKTLTMNYVSIQ